ncbi:Protocadherin gamma-A2 [Schistosoma japonicum]|uniref:Protocadherin gamma-A2 n=1 Tax=Schistosoma japonicum TaxID=6182 RepID=A0A4Z2DS05_SCHJA|nr:Protocadherin gamma-A2 [Schistosoma japonicum]
MSITYRIQEELPYGSLVGNLFNDVKKLYENYSFITSTTMLHSIKQLRKFELSAYHSNVKQMNQFFKLDQQTGDLFIQNRIDYEEICPKLLMHTTFHLYNSTDERWIPILIYIDDINDNQPKFYDINTLKPLNYFNVSIYENIPIVNDDDIGENSEITCSIHIDNDKDNWLKYSHITINLINNGQINNQYLYTLQILRNNDHSNELLINNQYDTMTLSTFTSSIIFLLITCNDNGKPTILTSSISLTIKLVDTKQSIELCFEQTTYELIIEETNQTLMNILRPQLLNVVNSVKFSLISLSRNKYPLINWEIIDVYTLQIRIEDMGYPIKLTSLETINIYVNDINDNSPKWYHTIESTSIQLNSMNNIIIYHIKPIWEINSNSPIELSTQLNAYDLDNEDNGKFHMYIIEPIYEYQEFIGNNRLPLPINAIDITSNGNVTLYIDQLEEIYEYYVFVRVQDHGIHRQLYTDGYLLIHLPIQTINKLELHNQHLQHLQHHHSNTNVTISYYDTFNTSQLHIESMHSTWLGLHELQFYHSQHMTTNPYSRDQLINNNNEINNCYHNSNDTSQQIIQQSIGYELFYPNNIMTSYNFNENEPYNAINTTVTTISNIY